MSLPYDKIFERNAKWVAEKTANDPHFFKRLSLKQSPEYLFIGCSDSRADPEEITGLELGQLFVHRNVANIVNPIDLNVASVVQYAVQNLNVKHIIVCGHYGCGGVSAALNQKGMAKSSPWLQIIRDTYRIHQKELENIETEEKRYDRLVELNVIEQCLNVIKMDCVQTRYGIKEFPTVHGWVYDIRNGILKDLNIDFDLELRDVLKYKNI